MEYSPERGLVLMFPALESGKVNLERPKAACAAVHSSDST